ncbi:MAG TPA: PfkB family carbohydrate kinase [Ktedonobacteraceae bacterium]
MAATVLQPLREGQCPTFLTLGHVTRDLLPGETFTLGGTVTFAALTAYHLGLAAGVVTCADQVLLSQLPALLPEIALAACSAPATTTFENSYQDGFRTQYLRGRASLLDLADIPLAWLNAPILLLGPLAQEIPPTLVQALPHPTGSLLAATPQGWLRRWDADGRVWPTPWEQAEALLPLLDILILSHDDLLPFAGNQRSAADALLGAWSMRVPLLIATDGRVGATLFENGKTKRFPAYPAHEVDPTGAGDVFAAAFLSHFYQHNDLYEAINFANCVASLSIERPGVSGIPGPAQIQARLLPLPLS